MTWPGVPFASASGAASGRRCCGHCRARRRCGPRPGSPPAASARQTTRWRAPVPSGNRQYRVWSWNAAVSSLGAPPPHRPTSRCAVCRSPGRLRRGPAAQACTVRHVDGVRRIERDLRRAAAAGGAGGSSGTPPLEGEAAEAFAGERRAPARARLRGGAAPPAGRRNRRAAPRRPRSCRAGRAPVRRALAPPRARCRRRAPRGRDRRRWRAGADTDRPAAAGL